jgi:hypothetical protein
MSIIFPKDFIEGGDFFCYWTEKKQPAEHNRFVELQLWLMVKPGVIMIADSLEMMLDIKSMAVTAPRQFMKYPD